MNDREIPILASMASGIPEGSAYAKDIARAFAFALALAAGACPSIRYRTGTGSPMTRKGACRLRAHSRTFGVRSDADDSTGMMAALPRIDGKAPGPPTVPGTAGMLVLLIIYSFAAQGCAALGVVAVGNRSSSVANPNISVNARCITEEMKGALPVTSGELRAYWGDPHIMQRNGSGSERWIYREGIRWNGIVVGFLIPIPVMVPVGRDYIEFTVDNGIVVSAFMKNDSGMFGIMIYEYLSEETVSNPGAPPNVIPHNSIGHQDNSVLPAFLCSEQSDMLREAGVTSWPH